MADVQKDKFVIGNATVMLAPITEDVFTLVPDTHSVGMVKSVSMEEQSDQIALRNGIRQLTVDTVKSNVNMLITFEGYEFDAKNLTYALGMTGATVQRLRGSLDTAVVATDTSLSLVSDPLPNDANSLIDANSDIPDGATLVIQRADEPDYVYVTKATAATTGVGPFVVTVDAIPAGISFSIGDYVWVVNEIEAGSFDDDEFFCAKIVGYLSSNQEPITVIIPKLKITRGFNLSFSETDYSNLPFELSPIVMSKSEATGKLVGFENTLARAYVGG